MSVVGSYGSSVGFSGPLSRLVDDSASIKNRLDRITQQVATGLVSQTYGGLGGTAQLSLDLRPQLARVDVFGRNITSATTRTDVSSQVLDQLQQIASTLTGNFKRLFKLALVAFCIAHDVGGFSPNPTTDFSTKLT